MYMCIEYLHIYIVHPSLLKFNALGMCVNYGHQLHHIHEPLGWVGRVPWDKGA